MIIKFRAWDKINKIMIPWEVLKSLSTNSICDTKTEKVEFTTYKEYITCVNLLTGVVSEKGLFPEKESVSFDTTFVRYVRGYNFWDDENFIKMQYTGFKDWSG